MDAALLARAITAAASIARSLGLPVEDTAVIQNSNTLALRLLPCDVFARTALAGQNVAAFEVRIARRLAALAAPVASLDLRVEPRVYQRDGFAVTFWTYCHTAADRIEPPDYAHALHRLHSAMRSLEVDAPHFTDRIADAEHILTQPEKTPALAGDDRLMLLDTLRGARQAVRGYGAADQLLHGEPHPGNLLSTADGPLFIDFETCCRGPVEFDVAHLPEDVSLHYPDVDRVLLQQCRRLILAMVAAWRWDAGDEFPNGRHHGLNIIRLLREGPPWPALAALSIE